MEREHYRHGKPREAAHTALRDVSARIGRNETLADIGRHDGLGTIVVDHPRRRRRGRMMEPNTASIARLVSEVFGVGESCAQPIEDAILAESVSGPHNYAAARGEVLRAIEALRVTAVAASEAERGHADPLLRYMTAEEFYDYYCSLTQERAR